MARRQLRTIHVTGAVVALFAVGTFLVATVAVEVTGDEHLIAAVNEAIARAVFLLAPVMIATGLSGRRLAGKSRAAIVVRKMRRMRLVGLNAVVVLIPCALTLARLAADRNFGPSFMALQSVELIAGSVNFTLLAMNMRDGFALQTRSPRLRSKEAGSGARS